MTDPSIPEAVRRLIQKSIATVKAHRELRRAVVDGVPEAGRAKYRKALQNALVELDAAVVAWSPEKKVSGPGFDWGGFFRTATRGLELVRDLKGGKAGIREAKEFVEAEVIDMKTKR